MIAHRILLTTIIMVAIAGPVFASEVLPMFDISGLVSVEELPKMMLT